MKTQITGTITTQFSKAQTDRFAKLAIAEAREALGDGWSWVTATVRDAIVESAILTISHRWDNSENIAVSALEPIHVRAMHILHGRSGNKNG